MRVTTLIYDDFTVIALQSTRLILVRYIGQPPHRLSKPHQMKCSKTIFNCNAFTPFQLTGLSVKEIYNLLFFSTPYCVLFYGTNYSPKKNFVNTIL